MTAESAQPYDPAVEQQGMMPQPPQPAPVVPTNTQPPPTGLAFKQRHPVTVWLLWPLLTLGIYHLVWYYKIHKEMAQFDRRRAVPIAGPMLVLLFLGWTFVAPMISYYNCGTRIRAAQRAAGLQVSCSAGIGTVLMLLLGAGTLYYQIELNKISESYDVPEGDQITLRA